jgi:hypothetical protein
VVDWSDGLERLSAKSFSLPLMKWISNGIQFSFSAHSRCLSLVILNLLYAPRFLWWLKEIIFRRLLKMRDRFALKVLIGPRSSFLIVE